MTDILDSSEKSRMPRSGDISWPVAPIPSDAEPVVTPEIKRHPAPPTYDEFTQIIDQGIEKSRSSGWDKLKIFWDSEWKHLGEFLAAVHYKDFGFTNEQYSQLLDTYLPIVVGYDGPPIDHTKEFERSLAKAATNVVTAGGLSSTVGPVHGARSPDWSERAAGDFEKE